MEKVKYLCYAIFTYLNLNQETFSILMILMCIDSLLGAVKAVRLGRDFQFKTMLWGITMKLIFLMIPVTLALMAKSLGYDFVVAINIVMAILTVSEGYSIMGNIYMAKNKVILKKMDVVSGLLIAIRAGLSRTLSSLIGKVESNDNFKK